MVEPTKSHRSAALRESSEDTNAYIWRKLSATLVTVSPCRVTSSGREEVASWSLFCTCICATSGLVSGSKVRRMDTCPALSLVELMYIRPSMPLSFCSMTCVTVSSSVCAEAPEYLAVIVTTGGAMRGYFATGRRKIEIPPAIMIRMAMTHANTGRSIKKRAMSSRKVEWLYQGRRGMGFSPVPARPCGHAGGRRVSRLLPAPAGPVSPAESVRSQGNKGARSAAGFLERPRVLIPRPAP